MTTTHFVSKNASLDYDIKTQTILISYQGEVSASSVLRVHTWMREVVSHFGIKNVRGTVVDLRRVVKFPPNVLTTLHVDGIDGREVYDFCEIPAAMVVRNAYQEKMLSMAASTEHVEQLRMVHEMQSAQAFIDSCYPQRKRTGLLGIPALFGSSLSAARA